MKELIGISRRELAALAAAVACATLGPWLLAGDIDRRVARAVDLLSDVTGSSVSIGRVHASLIGSVRLDDVTIGGVLEAGAVEASVSLPSFLSGQLRADEIRVERPRLHVRLGEDGHFNVERIAARVASRLRSRHEPADASEPTTLRRILVVGGDLVVELGKRGRVRARGVELFPQASGLRAVASSLDAFVSTGAATSHARFRRAGADIALPGLDVRRFLAVGGALEITGNGGRPTALVDATVSRGIRPGFALELDARVGKTGEQGKVSIALETSGHRLRVVVSGDRIPLAPLTGVLPRWLDVSRATATGRASWTPGASEWIDVDARLAELVIDHENVATAPVRLDGYVRTTLRVVRESGWGIVDIESSSFRLGQLELLASGHAERRIGHDPWERVDLRVTLPPTACDGALASLPDPFRHQLTGLTTRGVVGGFLAVAFDRAQPEATQLDVDVQIDGCQVVREPLFADPRSLLAATDYRFPNGSRRRIGRNEPGYVRLSRLPSYVPAAWIAAEDARFYDHNGFDVHQIGRSLAINLTEGALIRGESTISQQLVKNVFLHPRRTLARKLQEAVLTWRVEAHVPKRVILERYLNMIELGPGTYGIDAAARHWFGKSARRLDVRETAFLAALTPAPRTLSARIVSAGGIDAAMHNRIDIVLRAMRQSRVIGDSIYRRARKQRLVLAEH